MSDIHVAHFTPTEQRLAEERRARQQRIRSRAVADDGIDLKRKKAPQPKNVGIPVAQETPEIPQEPAPIVPLSTFDLETRIAELEAEVAHLRGDRTYVDTVYKTPTIEAVQRKVCQFYKISIIELLSPRKQSDIVYARQIAMYLSRKLTMKGFPQIGRKFRRDHSTVVHATQRVEQLKQTDLRMASDLDALAQEILKGTE